MWPKQHGNWDFCGPMTWSQEKKQYTYMDTWWYMYYTHVQSISINELMEKKTQRNPWFLLYNEWTRKIGGLPAVYALGTCTLGTLVLENCKCFVFYWNHPLAGIMFQKSIQVNDMVDEILGQSLGSFRKTCRTTGHLVLCIMKNMKQREQQKWKNSEWGWKYNRMDLDKCQQSLIGGFNPSEKY